ncbi:uncharacterized protein LOC119164521 isoform X2 [Rhipicephalus microplus]|uniref:uncharacterized protein LOC119164521 isoform X2 n=1 Tax=Rhipicephalus microplus TaxID=6941 RepID=UPI003F6D9B54
MVRMKREKRGLDMLKGNGCVQVLSGSVGKQTPPYATLTSRLSKPSVSVEPARVQRPYIMPRSTTSTPRLRRCRHPLPARSPRPELHARLQRVTNLSDVGNAVKMDESLYSSTCPKSTQEQAESLRPSRRGENVAVGTPRISNLDLCKSSQASVVPIRIHRCTDTSDLFEDLQDIADAKEELPFAQGLLWPRNKGSGTTASHSGEVCKIQQCASSSGNESPGAATILHQTPCRSRRASRTAPKRSCDTCMANGSKKRPKNMDSLDMKRQKKRERMRMLRANMSPGAKAREAERKRRERAAASPHTKAKDAERKRRQRLLASKDARAREAERKRRQRAAASLGAKAGEGEPERRQRAAASLGAKAGEGEPERRQRAAASLGAEAGEGELEQWQRAAASLGAKAGEVEPRQRQRATASLGAKARKGERAKARAVEPRQRQGATASVGAKARERERAKAREGEPRRRQRAAVSSSAKAGEVQNPVPAELVGAKRKVVQRCPRGDCALLVETATILGKEGSSPSAEAGSTINVYRCSYCFKEFRKIQDLTSHVRMCLWLQPRKCPLCSNVCSNWISMQDHIAMHVEELGTKCPLCECAVVGGNKDVLRHIMQHLTFKPFLCGVCKSTFLHGYDIAAHVCKPPSQRGRWAFPLRTTP